MYRIHVLLQKVITLLLAISLVGCQIGISEFDSENSRSEQAKFISFIQESSIDFSILDDVIVSKGIDNLEYRNIAEAYNYIRENPVDAYREMLSEEKGQELVDLLISLYDGAETEQVIEKMRPFLSEKELLDFQDQASVIVSNIASSKSLRPGDALHLMAGAATGCLAASILAACSWFNPIAQAAAIAGAALCAATLAGFAKEALIDVGIRQSQFDSVDIWWTVFGGGIAAVFGVVLTSVITDPLAGAAILGTIGGCLGIHIGIQFVKQLAG